MVNQILDITKETCPMTFVKTKLELAKLDKEDILDVILDEGESLDNVPKSVSEQGFKILNIERVEERIHKIRIEK